MNLVTEFSSRIHFICKVFITCQIERHFAKISGKSICVLKSGTGSREEPEHENRAQPVILYHGNVWCRYYVFQLLTVHKSNLQLSKNGIEQVNETYKMLKGKDQKEIESYMRINPLKNNECEETVTLKLVSSP